MEIKVNEGDLKEIVTNVVSRVIKEHDYEEDYIKANRKGSREAEREMKGDGFKPLTKVHKSQKQYSRKGKNNFKWNEDDTF